MLSSIKLNSINNDSIIHNLSASCKIISLFLLLIISMVAPFSKHLYIVLFIGIMMLLSKVNVLEYFKALRSVFYLLLGIFIINLIFQTSMEQNIINILMIVEVVLYSSLMTLTTSSQDMVVGVTDILKPFKIFKLDILKISFIITLVLRFIPIIIDEVNDILYTLYAKGASFKRKPLLMLKSIIIPTFGKTIEQADNLSDAYTMRLFNYENIKMPTKGKWGFLDILLIIILVTGVIVCAI